MKFFITLLIFINLFLTGHSQDFKYIKPKLTDSTKVVKTEINTQDQFERIYFIDYAINSQAKADVKNFGDVKTNLSESIGSTYLGILNNLKNKPKKINLNLPERWVRIFKYQGKYVLFNDIPKYILTDTCLVTFEMDDPISSVIVDYKQKDNFFEYDLLSYNWENSTINQKYYLKIKFLDSTKQIALWRFEFQEQVTYYLMIPINQVSSFPTMVVLETDLMDDETDIFDKIKYEELWNK